MLTVSQAATRLGRNPETIRRWIRSGRLPARKLGAQHVIGEDDLASMIHGDTMPVLEGWKGTITGEPMPDVIAAIRRSRAGH